jgi:hypothetical protein
VDLVGRDRQRGVTRDLTRPVVAVHASIVARMGRLHGGAPQQRLALDPEFDIDKYASEGTAADALPRPSPDPGDVRSPGLAERSAAWNQRYLRSGSTGT